MTRRLRNVTVIAAVAVWFSSSTGAQQPPAGHAHDDDTHHREMLTRGTRAMGFDQERAAHHFLLYEDGGAIDVAVKEVSDHANLHAVRQHLQHIAGLFKAGDFGKPALTHAQQVPGTADMTRLKERITYQYEETAGGGRVRIVTRNAEALAAVHAFLHFQIEDHRTGDSGLVQKPIAPGRAMHGMGPEMMTPGGHDTGTMAQMRDIHELFANHDRMTRTVSNLADGIRTMTESNGPRFATLITDFTTDGMAAMHKAMMKNGGMVQHGMHGGAMEIAPRRKTTPTPR
jgi:hypothetical protein